MHHVVDHAAKTPSHHPRRCDEYLINSAVSAIKRCPVLKGRSLKCSNQFVITRNALALIKIEVGRAVGHVKMSLRLRRI
jgi:hypothetical protein